MEALRQRTGEGIEKVKEFPLHEFFPPTSTPVRESLGQAGEFLKKIPSTRIDLKIPDAPEIGSKLIDPLFKAQQEKMELGSKFTGAITSMPGEMIRSYGETMSKIGSGVKLGLEDYLNISDFVPGIGFIGVGGIKPVAKTIGKEVVEKVGKEAVEKIGKEAIEKTGKEVVEKITKKGTQVGIDLGDIGTPIAKTGKEAVEQVLPDAELKFLAKKADVKGKVNILDYLRTPEQVLEKIGLVKEKKALRTAWEGYQTQLKSELEKINTWKQSVPKESSQRIFDYLDGATNAKQLNANELKIGSEIKTYLKDWANKLNIPEEEKITNYITHLFAREKEGVEFPTEIAKQIKDKTAGSVYDPFLETRIGRPDYVRDVWRGLEAYVKRGTRKVNLDPALAQLKTASEKLDPETEKYITRLSHRINLRPTEVDNLLDNLIKQSPIGYRFTERPTAHLTKGWRQMIYRGALGMNVGSAMRNLTQGVNTYATLGEKYTAIGYSKAVQHLMRNDFDELIKHNVLSGNIVQDRETTLAKTALQKIDPVLFSLFDFAEKINRSSAYFGAKKQALDKGLSVNEAVDYGKEVVRKTQFAYSQIDQPVLLASDLVKTLTQFQSFNIKQTEFLAGLVKDKDFMGMVRFTMGSLFLTGTFGKMFGMDLKEFIPYSDARFSSPAVQLIGGLKDVALGGERQKTEGERKLKGLAPLVVPGGVQLKKSLQGAITGERGYTATATGRLRYPVGQSPLEKLQLLVFGQYSPQEAQEYYGKGRSPLGEKQTKEFEKYGLPYYQKIIREREAKERLTK
ncbi:MAG TPA: hypothetical protein ENI23_05680 [bacterium]|nr:hypothetical protein [bacterium]